MNMTRPVSRTPSLSSAKNDDVMRLEHPMNLPSRKPATSLPDPLKHFAREPAEVKLEALRTHSRYALATRVVTVLGTGSVGTVVVMAVKHWLQ